MIGQNVEEFADPSGHKVVASVVKRLDLFHDNLKQQIKIPVFDRLPDSLHINPKILIHGPVPESGNFSDKASGFFNFVQLICVVGGIKPFAQTFRRFQLPFGVTLIAPIFSWQVVSTSVCTECLCVTSGNCKRP